MKLASGQLSVHSSRYICARDRVIRADLTYNTEDARLGYRISDISHTLGFRDSGHIARVARSAAMSQQPTASTYTRVVSGNSSLCELVARWSITQRWTVPVSCVAPSEDHVSAHLYHLIYIYHSGAHTLYYITRIHAFI